MSFFTNNITNHIDVLTTSNTTIRDLKITSCYYLQIVRELREYLKKYDIIKQNFTYSSNINLLSISMQNKINWNKLGENGKSLLLMLAEIFGTKIEFYDSIKKFIVDIIAFTTHKKSLNNIIDYLSWEWDWDLDWCSKIDNDIFNTVKKELIKCRKRRRSYYNTKIINYFESHMRDIFIKYNNLNMPIDVFVNIFKYIDFDGCIHCKNDCKSIDIIMSHDSVNCTYISKNMQCKYCYDHRNKVQILNERGIYLPNTHLSHNCDCIGLFFYNVEVEVKEEDYKLVTEYNYLDKPYVFVPDIFIPDFLEHDLLFQHDDIDDFDLLDNNPNADIINHGDNNMLVWG